MSPELLKKCIAGNASDSEWEEYLLWMDGDGSDAFDDPHLEIDLDIQQRSWKKIRASNLKYEQSRTRKLWLLSSSVAAVLAFLCAFIFFKQKESQERQYEIFTYNALSPAIEKTFNGLNIRLAKNSEVVMNRESNQLIDVYFSGAVMLSNNSDEDQYIIVRSESSKPNEATKKMCLRKGQSYLLSYYTSKKDELLVVNKQRLLDIPPAIALNMRQDFNL
ncbi:hypothetical protein [Pedobacter sp.]|uniref:hypothetical protein n=1 Tax=Pedobacter sp. TaxID=1411316 RepID=UPI002BBA7B58|nr:hypothetical protein [Pedobacter sp.]HWW38789.1 hypothetical protein [Pedobacter sp.]